MAKSEAKTFSSQASTGSAGAASQVAASACVLDCPDLCSLSVEITDGRVTGIDGTEVNPITGGFICGKVRKFAGHVYGEERLRHPMLRDGPKGSGRFRPVDWDEALDRVCGEIRRIVERSGGEAILPYAYGGSNGYFTDGSVDARLFARLGASRLLRTVCAAPSGAAQRGLYGRMQGVAIDDYQHAELIVLWGVNPSASGIHIIPYINEARRRGARLVVCDPRATPLARGADLHLALRPGTDLPVALAVIHHLFATGAADEAFLARHTTGADILRERASSWSIERAAEVAGVPAADLRRFATLYAETSPAVIRCGWGQERNRNGGGATAAILALPAVAGKFGVRGGGYTHSSGGAWKLDLQPAVAADQPDTRAINMNRLGHVLQELRDPPIELLFVYNCNPVATVPDQNAVRRGLSRDDLFTVVFDQVHTDTATYADVILPATTFLEHRELRRGYGSTRLFDVAPVIERVGEARPNYEVFADLCRRLGLERPGDPTTADELAAAILGGEEHREVVAALADQGVATPPSGTHPVLFVDVFPETDDGKVHLVPDHLDREAEGGLYRYAPDPATEAYPLALISPATSRMISSTLGQLMTRGARLQMHPDDAGARGIGSGDPVRVWNDLGEVRCAASVSREIRPGVVSLSKGLWLRHTDNGSTSNALVPDSSSDIAGGACFNDARVQVARCADAG